MDVLADKDMFDNSLFEEVRTSSVSQAQWAHRIGVSGGTISNWERGSTYPNNAYRQKILEAATNHLSLLGKSIGDIVGSQITSIDTRKTKNDLDIL
jgi:transcriptional regulator with XRE-family HTH domain